MLYLWLKQLIKVESGAARTRGIFTQNIGAINKSNKELIDSLQGSGISIEQFYAAIANGAAEGFSSLESFITALGETQAFINKTFEILEQGAENTLGDVAFAIGDALASGGNVIKAAGAALLGGLAGILNQLGQLAIATGLTITGIKKALQTLNPAVAIGAGIALVALAGFVSSKAKSLGSAAPGGGGGGGGGSSVGSSGVGGGSSFVGGAQGGRKLLESLGAVGRDAVYTNRAITPDNPDGVIPSQINGVDSAAYAYQLNDRLAFITPEQLDKFGARDGFLAKAWGMQYSKAADDAVSTFVTGTLAGPRFPLRNAIEDYLFGLANGRGVIRSAKDIVKARGVAKKVIQASEDLNFAVLNRYAKAKDKDNLLARMNAIDSGSELRWNATTKTWDKVDDVFKSPAKKEEAKRKVMAEALLRENFNDAQMGKFGSDFDRYAYEFAMYGDYENLLKGASEGAYNLNAGNDFFSRAKRLSRKHGKVVDFEVDGFKQVDWGIKYNMNRYGSMCKALNHFKTKGWH